MGRCLLFVTVLALFASRVSFADSLSMVVSQGFGVSDTVEEATDLALTDAVKRATGALIVSRSVSSFGLSGASNNTKTVSVVNGLVRNYKVISVDDAGRQGNVRVTVEAEVIPEATDNPRSDSGEGSVSSWVGEARRVASISEAQRKLREYQRVLEGFLGNAYDQLQAGYFISPRRYVIDSVGPDQVEGRLLVDIIVNESYWDAYYEILKAMTPVNSQGNFLEGHLDDSKSVSAKTGVAVDHALADYLAKPIPLVIGFKSPGGSSDGVQGHPARIVLYKNSVSNNHIRVGTGLERKSTRVEISHPSPISEPNSDLSCKVRGDYKYLYACGSRITIELPFKVKTEYQAKLLFQNGVAVGIGR